MTTSHRCAVAVIGIGSSFRGDDGVGPAAILELDLMDTAWAELGVELLVLDGEPTRLIDAWAGRKRVVLIDAMVLGAPAGTMHHLAYGADAVPSPAAKTTSHHMDIPEAFELGAALGTLPDELIVLGVEPADVSLGAGLSPAVERALPQLVARVAEVATSDDPHRWCGVGDDTPNG